jgi:glycosyltransferase involved in cell wall biosynthesis
MLENVPHEQIPGFLAGAELFVLPSRREGFPMVLLEAGAAGATVVAASCIGVPEIIADGVTGRLVPVDDAEALADAITALLSDPEERARMGRSLHQLVARDFSWTRAYSQYISL